MLNHPQDYYDYKSYPDKKKKTQKLTIPPKIIYDMT